MAKKLDSNSQGGVFNLRSAVYVVVFYTLISALLLVVPDVANAALGGALFAKWKQVIRFALCGSLTVSGLALWKGISQNNRGLMAIWLILYGMTTVFVFFVIGLGLISGQFNLYFPNYSWGFWNHKSVVEDAMIFGLIIFAGLDVLSLRTVYRQYQQLPKMKVK